MIIVCCGFSGSGKDQVAKRLIDEHGFIKLSFASVLKDILSIIFSWDRSMMEGATKESRDWREKIDEWWSDKLMIQHFTPRWAMQNIGTDLFRQYFNTDIWIFALEKKLKNLRNANVVITDCRFENEYNFLKNITYDEVKFFYIERCEPPLWFYNKVIPDDLHISEYEWVKCLLSNEYTTIPNYGTIDELNGIVDKIMI
jgi:hypothetical protein